MAVELDTAQLVASKGDLDEDAMVSLIAPSHDLVIVRRGLDWGRQGFDRWELLREILKTFG
ncbi:MAG: hypothetical protein R6U63_07805 [Longimicrobiales bacterium]